MLLIAKYNVNQDEDFELEKDSRLKDIDDNIEDFQPEEDSRLKDIDDNSLKKEEKKSSFWKSLFKIIISCLIIWGISYHEEKERKIRSGKELIEKLNEKQERQKLVDDILILNDLQIYFTKKPISLTKYPPSGPVTLNLKDAEDLNDVNLQSLKNIFKQIKEELKRFCLEILSDREKYKVGDIINFKRGFQIDVFELIINRIQQINDNSFFKDLNSTSTIRDHYKLIEDIIMNKTMTIEEKKKLIKSECKNINSLIKIFLTKLNEKLNEKFGKKDNFWEFDMEINSPFFSEEKEFFSSRKENEKLFFELAEIYHQKVDILHKNILNETISLQSLKEKKELLSKIWHTIEEIKGVSKAIEENKTPPTHLTGAEDRKIRILKIIDDLLKINHADTY